MRTRFIIYPKFQYSIIFANIAALLLCMAFIFFKIDATFSLMKEMANSANISPQHNFFTLLGLQQSVIFEKILMISSLYLIISTVAIILLSHKMAGPIVRLKSYLKELEETKTYTKLSFRKGDYFIDVCDQVNATLTTIMEKK